MHGRLSVLWRNAYSPRRSRDHCGVRRWWCWCRVLRRRVPDSYNTTVNKFAFPDDSRTTLGTGLTQGTYGLAGMANSGTAGYFGGGIAGGYTDVVAKFAFSDDSANDTKFGPVGG